MAQTLTLQQVSDKLFKVEEALNILQNKKGPENFKKIQKLNLVKESLLAEKNILSEEPKSTFVTTKAGETKVVTADTGEINTLKKDPNIKSMEDSTGKKLKEIESDVALNLDYVGKTITDLFADFLRDLGEEISNHSYDVVDGVLKVQVQYKEGSTKEYTFELKGNDLYLDGALLMQIQRLPSGEIQIPKETLNSSLYKYFENQVEFTDSELSEVVTDIEGENLYIGDKIRVGRIIFEICMDSKKNLVFLQTGSKVIYGGTKEFKTLLENSKKHNSELLEESVEIGDRVKISKSYGGARGSVVDKKDAFIKLENGELYPESVVVNVSRKVGEDVDLGHIDDEPGMLSQTAYEAAVHAASIYKQLKQYESLNKEIDFPNWWQSKVILAKDYVSKADNWLKFTSQEGNFMENKENKEVS